MGRAIRSVADAKTRARPNPVLDSSLGVLYELRATTAPGTRETPGAKP